MTLQPWENHGLSVHRVDILVHQASATLKLPSEALEALAAGVELEGHLEDVHSMDLIRWMIHRPSWLMQTTSSNQRSRWRISCRHGCRSRWWMPQGASLLPSARWCVHRQCRDISRQGSDGSIDWRAACCRTGDCFRRGPVVVAGRAAPALRLDGWWTGASLSGCGGGGDRVSGMTPDQDAAVARAGLEAFELKAQDCSS